MGMVKEYPHGYAHQTSEAYNNKSTMALVEVPGEVLSERGSVSDPATLRRWLVEALRTAHAAGRVSSDSPALLPLVPCPPPRARRKYRNAEKLRRWNRKMDDVDLTPPPGPPEGARRPVTCARCGVLLLEEVNDEKHRSGGWAWLMGPLSKALDEHKASGTCAAGRGWNFGEWS
jgi:hypothetical protein